MTDRIYYTAPTCRMFVATVTRSLEHDGRPAVLLSQTAFYPTSGGQPFDIGRLDDVDVVDVVDVDNDVVHVVSAPIAEGTEVRGEIDWRRRFDHNHLRITRIIKSLRLLCGDGPADNFRRDIKALAGNAPIDAQARAFWDRA